VTGTPSEAADVAKNSREGGPAGVWRWLERGGCRGRLRDSARRYFVYHPSTRSAAVSSGPVQVAGCVADYARERESAISTRKPVLYRLMAGWIDLKHDAKSEWPTVE
jgi:hypothetical protein